MNTLALFYNKDTLDKAGLKVPATWAEMRETAKKLTHGRQYGWRSARAARRTASSSSPPPSCGPTAATRRSSTAPEVAGGAGLLEELLKDGSLSKSTVNWTQADVNDQFMAGNAA